METCWDKRDSEWGREREIVNININIRINISALGEVFFMYELLLFKSVQVNLCGFVLVLQHIKNKCHIFHHYHYYYYVIFLYKRMMWYQYQCNVVEWSDDGDGIAWFFLFHFISFHVFIKKNIKKTVPIIAHYISPWFS